MDGLKKFGVRLTNDLEKIHRGTGIVRRTMLGTVVRPSLGKWWGKKKAPHSCTITYTRQTGIR